MLPKIASKALTIATGSLFSQYFCKNKLTILMYHGVVKEPLRIQDWCFIDQQNFTRQMQYIKANYDILPLSQAVKKLHQREITEPTMSVTFDDGFLNNYEVAYPITCAFEIPITIYISTDFVDSNDTLWYCRLNQALSQTKNKIFKWQDKNVCIENNAQKSKLSSVLQRELKKLPHNDLLRELDIIIEKLGLDPRTGLDRDSPFRVLDSNTIKLMSQSKNVEIGAHTHSHSILSKLSLNQKRKEIETSIQLIEQWTNSACRTFAYPNGRTEDYDTECIDLLQTCNIETAVTANIHTNVPSTSQLELGRYGIGSSTDFNSFKLIAHGVSPLLKTYRSKNH